MRENREARSVRHRPPRLELLSPGVRPFYFVTFNVCRRRALLAQAAVHLAFVQFCRQALDRGVTVGRYVLMPDHAHLFVAFQPGELALARWMQSLKNYVGKTLLQLGNKKPHWQERFFDHVLRSDESYAQKWEYVRLNPVRAGLVALPDDWPYQGEIAPIRF